MFDKYKYTIKKYDTIGLRLNNIFTNVYFLLKDSLLYADPYLPDNEFKPFDDLFSLNCKFEEHFGCYIDYTYNISNVFNNKPDIIWKAYNNQIGLLYYPFNILNNKYDSIKIKNTLKFWEEILDVIINLYNKENIENALHVKEQIKNLYNK